MSARAAVGQEFVPLRAHALGFDARRFLDDAVELFDALADFFLLLEELSLALIQGSAGFAGTTACGHDLLFGENETESDDDCDTKDHKREREG